jgi:ankyrin repeat protein
MSSILLLIFSLLILSSCGKHEQASMGRQGVGNTNTVNSLGTLSQYIVEEDTESLQKYIDAGGDLEAELSNGRTLLTEACFWLKLKTISFLIKHKVSLDRKDRSGMSALNYGEESLIIRRALFPELLIALKKSLFLAAKANQFNEMKKILEDNAPVNFLLLNAELELDIGEDEGESLLTFIVKKNLGNVLRLLTQPKYELDPNMQNVKGESPLFLAKKLNLKNIEKLLIRLGATQ